MKQPTYFCQMNDRTSQKRLSKSIKGCVKYISILEALGYVDSGLIRDRLHGGKTFHCRIISACGIDR